tara:strand:- start:172 stop:546 length:375 start_codon:yes stop_codon:yes gene_type:complete
MAPPTQSHRKRPLRLTPLAHGLPPHERRSLLAVRDALERILQQQPVLLPFEDIYRAGYNLCLARQHDALHDQYELAVKALRRVPKERARLSRRMFYDLNLYSERTAVFSRGVTSVLHMGTHALP